MVRSVGVHVDRLRRVERRVTTSFCDEFRSRGPGDGRARRWLECRGCAQTTTGEAHDCKRHIQITHRELPTESLRLRQPPLREPRRLTKFLPREYEGVISTSTSTGAPPPSATRSPTTSPTRPSGRWRSPRLRLRRHQGGGGFGTRQRPREAGGDARPRLVLRPRAAPGAHEGDRHRPHAAVADAGDRARGAHDRRPRCGVRRDPRAERVDARALELRVLGRHLQHAHHLARGARARD